MKQKKFFSISKKLIILLVVLILLPTISSGFISYQTASNITEEQIRVAANESISGIKENLTNFIRLQEENINILSQNMDFKEILSKQSDEMVYVYDALKGFKEGHKDILSIYIGLKNKGMHLYPEQKLPSGFDPTSRPWYQSAAKENKITWSDPYVDTGTGKLIVTVSIPVTNKNKELIGVLGADISLEHMSEFISGSKIGTKGYVILLDNKGVVLAHPDSSLLGKEIPIPELLEAVKANEKGSKDYIYNQSKKCAFYGTLGYTGWKILGTFEYSEITAYTNSILVRTIVSAVIIVLIAIILGIFASRPMLQSIKVLSEDMLKIGNGDFTIRSNVKSSDEIGILAQTVNKMAEELGDLMRKIKATSMSVATSADSLAASSEETTASTEEISRTVVEIANATEDQAKSTENGLVKTTELAQNLQGISDGISEISSVATYSNTLNEKGLEIMEDLMEKTKENGIAAVQVTEVITEVDQSSQKIGVILGTISSIADQTNLLALNASIEAARAGEQGRGFAVVADEIRKLADQSSNATKNIRILVSEIQTKSQNAVATMKQVNPTVEAQGIAVTATQAIFNDISDTIFKLMEEVSGITDLNENMVKSKNDILSIMENISASAEQTSASTQQVAASAQEQLAGMEEVAKTAEQLNILAHDLNNEVMKFKV